MAPLDGDSLREIFLRLGLAAAFGAVLGVNRDLHRKPAGLRVLALVALSSAVVTTTCLALLAETEQQIPDAVFRGVQGILSGIGFLGAGVILRGTKEGAVHGLATAASIWIAAVLGITCGLGIWKIAFAALTVALVILVLGLRIENCVLRCVKQPGRETEE